MGIFLENFQQENQDAIHILPLDNAPIHICVAVSFRTAKKLKVSDNIILLFQPPYCPEVNPIERVWEYIKYRWRSQWFINLNDVKDKVARILNSLSTNIIASLAGWEYFTTALSL